MNENILAQIVCKRESGKVQVNIAQVKEVIKIIKSELAKKKASEVLAWIGK